MRRFLSPALANDADALPLRLATARQSVGLLLATGLLALVAACLGLARVAGLLGAAEAYSAFTLAVLRAAPTIAVVRFTGAAGLLLFLTAVAWTERALLPVALAWLVLLPLVGTLIDGRRVGVGFAALSAALTLGTLVADARGLIPPTAVSAGTAWWFTAAAHVTLIAVVVGIAAYFGDARVAALSRLAGAERELARAREQALLAERLAALGTLAAGVAHEINNPMAFVAGNVEVVLRQIRSASRRGEPLDLREAEAALIESMTGASRVREIVADLRTFAHAPDETTSSVDAGKLVAAVSRIVHNELRHRSVLTIKVEPGLTLEASESRLAQVLVNLLSNAIQAMPDRPPEGNHISLAARSVGDGRAEIVVADDTGGAFDATSRALIERVESRCLQKPCNTATLELLIEQLARSPGPASGVLSPP